MRIFITGASGYIGRAVAAEAIKRGHSVVGLSRSETSTQILKQLGVTDLLGDLHSVGALEQGAAEADAVLHLAFNHDWNADLAEVLETDKTSVEIMAEKLRGTDKPIVVTSGTCVVAPDAEGEETNEWSPSSDDFVLKDRIHAERASLALASRGVRISALRLAPYVYGRGGSTFVPLLIRAASERGVSAYVQDGTKRTSAVHVDDVAQAYLLAAEKAEAGSVFNCTSETDITTRAMAEAIGEAVGVPVKGKSRTEAEALWGPFLTAFVDYENRASSERLRNLGWQPKASPGMLEDIRNGSYREMAQSLRNGR